MTETTNYHLTQWVKDDRIRMVDFNADNEKIDEALHGVADRVGVLEGGALRIAAGSYTGNGKYDESNPVTLELGFRPRLLLVFEEGSNPQHRMFAFEAMRTCPMRTGYLSGDPSGTCHLTWNDTGVSWWFEGTYGFLSMNYEQYTYHYFALG